ncbi:J domain-containing protein 1 [Recurvomyces mirabilis]|nr:J domain-containing protein 1 [Recurvomyces mirabilis]
MLSKKPSLLISAYCSFHSLHNAAGSTTSSCRRPRDGTRLSTRADDAKRSYATITGDHDAHHEEPREAPKRKPEHQWPVAPTGHQHPTPYQILSMKTTTATYTKARYYQLVKMYHPDLSHTATSNHPYPMNATIKMERYRLIVAAHTILSDPVKRSAYDRFGSGWNGKPEVGARASNSTYAHPGPGPFSQSWQTGNQSADPIWQNATWEDWEKFYAWRARRASDPNASPTDDPHQSPLYMRNSYFVLLVAVLAFAGGSANYNRAQDAGTYFVEQRDLVHDRAAKELRRVRQEVAGVGSRDERIQWFLRQREATMGNLANDEVETGDAQSLSFAALKAIETLDVCSLATAHLRDRAPYGLPLLCIRMAISPALLRAPMGIGSPSSASFG